nr:protein of unknown function [Escherichia coli]
MDAGPPAANTGSAWDYTIPGDVNLIRGHDVKQRRTGGVRLTTVAINRLVFP